MPELAELVESRLQAMEAERDRLVEAWKPNIDSVKKYYAKQGKELSRMDERNIARCLENALLESAVRTRSKIFETTDTSSIQFLGIQLPVISALLPSLVLNKIATVQALDRRSAGVFYLDVKYGMNKGGITAGQKMIDAKAGQNRTSDGKMYASTRVMAEVITSTSGTLKYFPVISLSLVITNGTETLTETSAGVLTSDLSGGRTGTIDPATGNWTITGGLSGGGVMTAQYRYNYETGGYQGAVASNVPTVNVSVSYETVTAEDFPLRADYTLASAIDLEKAHGLNLEDEIVKYLGGEVKFTIDHYGIDQINTAAQSADAATTPGTYVAAPSTGEAWVNDYMPTKKMFNSVKRSDCRYN